MKTVQVNMNELTSVVPSCCRLCHAGKEYIGHRIAAEEREEGLEPDRLALKI